MATTPSYSRETARSLTLDSRTKLREKPRLSHDLRILFMVLATRLRVEVVPGLEVTIQADGDQLEQLLINLLRNAVDAALETDGGVRVGWLVHGGHIELWIEDDGPGVSNSANLFVPFFTTKTGGSGIGLVLSRQIAEAHGGTLTLENRKAGHGCEARLRLPMGAASPLTQ